jgi:hypothetical protein
MIVCQKPDLFLRRKSRSGTKIRFFRDLSLTPAEPRSRKNMVFFKTIPERALRVFWFRNSEEELYFGLLSKKKSIKKLKL